jgi:hypothetical protein
LGYELSADRKLNGKFWLAFSQMMIYRDPRSLDQMAFARLTRMLPTTGGEAVSKNNSGNGDEDRQPKLGGDRQAVCDGMVCLPSLPDIGS